MKMCSEEFPDIVGSDDVALHVFTSGTTGRAKAAKMKHSRYENVLQFIILM